MSCERVSCDRPHEADRPSFGALLDEDLRTLERNLTQQQDAGSTIAYARALGRLGRNDEAYATLARGVDEPSVREELARLPAWTHESGGPGRSRSIDVAPIRSAPSVRWTVVTTPLEPIYAPHFLLASPLGIVTSLFDLDGWVVAVLDPETGERLWAVRAAVRPLPTIVGSVLLVSVGLKLVFAFDLRTGERLYRIPRDGVLVAGDSRLLLVEDEHTLVSFSLDSPRRAPSIGPLRLGRPVSRHQPTSCIAAGPLLVVEDPLGGQILALDRRTGSTLWAKGGLTGRVGAGLLGDEAGVGGATDAPTFALRDDGGALIASIPGAPLALARDAVVVQSETRVATHDRETGELRAVLFPRRWPTRFRPAAVARDVVYLPRATGGIGAWTLDGKRLWVHESAIPARQEVVIAAYSRRLYVRAMPFTDGPVSISCLEES